MSKLSTQQVFHISKLAGIPISKTEAEHLTTAFNETFSVIDNLQSVDTSKVEPTHQVTNLQNIWREDKVDKDRMLTQEQALSSAKKTHQGFFIVEHLLENKDA